MSASVKETALARGTLYLEGLGFSPAEARGRAEALWTAPPFEADGPGGQSAMAEYMGRVIDLGQTLAPPAPGNRPLSLGHMLAADFQSAPERREPLSSGVTKVDEDEVEP